MHAAVYIYTFYMLRYSTYATFPLIASFGARDTSEQFSKEKYVIRLLLTRATTNYRGHRPRFAAPAPVMMRERISVEVARVVTNFLTVVSAARTCRVGASGRVCMRGLAWLCRDSSLQFVQWSKATAGVREHYRR